MIALSGNLKEFWKTLRQTVFWHVIKCPMPKETSFTFGLSYFDVILKSCLKLYTKVLNFINNESEIIMLKESIQKIMREWLIAEENLTLKTKNMIKETLEGTRWEVETWQQHLQSEQGNRLLKNRNINDNLGAKLCKIKLPNVLLKLSNSPIHEIEQRIKRYITTENEEEKEIKLTYITQIIGDLLTAGYYIGKSKPSLIHDEQNVEIDELIASYTLLEIEVENKAKDIQNIMLSEHSPYEFLESKTKE